MLQVTPCTNDHYISPPRETNLKVRQALPATAGLGDSEDQLSAFNGRWMVLTFIATGPGSSLPTHTTHVATYQYKCTSVSVEGYPQD